MVDFLVHILIAFPDLQFNDVKISPLQIHVNPQASEGKTKSNFLSNELPPGIGLALPPTPYAFVKMEWTCSGRQKGPIFGVHVTNDKKKVSAQVSLTCAWEGGLHRLSSSVPSDRQ